MTSTMQHEPAMPGFEAARDGECAWYSKRRRRIESAMAHYAENLGMPAAVVSRMHEMAHDLWECFGRGSPFHRIPVFAEVLAFHAMKACGQPLDAERFRAASLVGTMAIGRHPG